ncbi:protein kinase family protein [Candidatus Bathyarchaeota archaeon]|nr:protein kinase family protein [Candidatus Bathyarchaeota archaeon]
MWYSYADHSAVPSTSALPSARPLSRASSSDSDSDMAVSSDPCQIIEATEQWTHEGDDSVFKNTKLFYRQGYYVYAATIIKRKSDLDDLDDLDLASLKRVMVPTEDFCPVYEDHLTKAPTPLPKGSYVKTPKLFHWNADDGEAIAANVLREAEAYEKIKDVGPKHIFALFAPYVALEKYHGVVIHCGRITGFCVKKYDTTLIERLEAGTVTEEKRCEWAGALASGIELLHSRGLAHNDVNPSNVMMDGDTPVLVNFGHCRPVGEKLAEPRSVDSLPEGVETSEFGNDLYGLERITDRILLVKKDRPTGAWVPIHNPALNYEILFGPYF